MKIAFFTEGGFTGIIPRNDGNLRVPQSWMASLNAYHYNIHNPNIDTNYDLGIIIIPKKNPQFNLDNIKQFCNQISFMQEGPHWYFQDYPLDQQIWYYNILQEMDFLFVHNQLDKKYYEGLTDKKCYILQSLMVEDSINSLPSIERSGVMIGGNFCNWYGGFDSYITAQEFNTDIFIPSMGRRIEGEEQLPNLNHLPYMNWVGWINELNKVKYGVHLMRTHAAGTFALNCAYLGIPCIGYKGLDTQEICHPDLTVEVGDLKKSKNLAKELRNNQEFYVHCSKISKQKYKQHFHENIFNTTLKEQLKIS
jgi:hypothetical protein